MSDDLMTTDQIVNIFCNMQGVEMNEVQRTALSNLIQTIFESGQQTKEDTITCTGCETLVPEDDTEIQTYPSLKGLGSYCSDCRREACRCDCCDQCDNLTPAVIEAFSIKVGYYCKFCIQSSKEKQ